MCIFWSTLCFLKDSIIFCFLEKDISSSYIKLWWEQVTWFLVGFFPPQGANVGVLNCSVHCKVVLDSWLICQTTQSLPKHQKFKFRAQEIAQRGQKHALAQLSSYLILHNFWIRLGATQLQIQTALPSTPRHLFAFSGIAGCLTFKPLRVIEPITKCTVSFPWWSAKQLQFTSKFQELLITANMLTSSCLKNTTSTKPSV